MDHKLSSDEIKKLQEYEAVMKEMLPYFGLAALPIILTLILAVTFAPNMTLP
jgi:hypothetical protein